MGFDGSLVSYFYMFWSFAGWLNDIIEDDDIYVEVLNLSIYQR